MNNTEWYIAYFLQESPVFGKQIVRYAFEYPKVEYWGEPEEQEKMKDYFQKHHYRNDRPYSIEKADFIDGMPYSAAAIKNPIELSEELTKFPVTIELSSSPSGDTGELIPNEPPKEKEK